MNVTPIDLSALDAFDITGANGGKGRPLLIELDLIHEDPNQPRKTFNDILELASSISEVGIKVPISVRPHPVMHGHYMVKFGARRRRAAIAAGLNQIPAWIDDMPSDFEQVIENLQRSDLSPLELAMFIAEKVTAGMRHADIAQRLGINRTSISKHLALIDAPAEVEAVYRSGRSTSPETIFELRSVYARYPEQTKAWLAQDHDVSRRSIEDLKRRLMSKTETSVETLQSKRAKAARPDVPPVDPSDIKRPVVVVKVGGRQGIVVLNRRPASDNQILIKWDDTAEVEEVPSSDVRLLRIDDARRYEPINLGLKPATEASASPHGDANAHP